MTLLVLVDNCQKVSPANSQKHYLLYLFWTVYPTMRVYNFLCLQPSILFKDEPYLYGRLSSINIVTPATVDMSSVET